MLATKFPKSSHHNHDPSTRMIPEFNRKEAPVKRLFPNRFPTNKLYKYTQVIFAASNNVVSKPDYMNANHPEFVQMMNWLRKCNFKNCPRLAMKFSNSSLQSKTQTYGSQFKSGESLYPRLRNLCNHLAMQITLQISRNTQGTLSLSNTNIASLKELYTLSTKTKTTAAQEISSMGPLLRRLVNPVSLSLNFRTMEELSYQGITFLNSKRILCLKELDISLNWKISWVRLYNSMLCYLQKHGKIRLNLEYNKMYSTPKVNIKIQQTPAGRVIDCKIQAWFDSGFSIYDMCYNISSLEALRIYFSGDDVYIDKNFSSEFNFQEVNAIKLKRFELEFSHQFLLTIDGFNSLGQLISNHFSTLETLNLSFTRCLNINPQFSRILRDSIISRLQTLRHLGLSFIHCQKLTDEDLNTLSTCFTDPLQTLKSINLSFINCDKITNAGMKNLGYSVYSPLDSMEALTLRIKDCCRITSSGIDELRTCLKTSLSEIKTLNIDFQSNGAIISEELFWEPETGELFQDQDIEYDYPDFSEVHSYMHDYDLEEFSNYDYGSDPDDAAYQYYPEYDYENNYYANDTQYEHFDFKEFFDFETEFGPDYPVQ